MSYSYVVTSQKPTAVHRALVCRFTSPSAQNLILAKSNHLEIHVLAEDCLQPICDTTLYGNQEGDSIAFVSSFSLYLHFIGKICNLEVLRLPKYAADCIFVVTEKKNFCVLSYDETSHQILSVASGSLSDKIGMEMDGYPHSKADFDCSMVALLLYEGLVKIVPIEQGVFRDAFNARVDETSILDMCFLAGQPRPTLCVLYEEGRPRSARHIKSYIVDLKEKELIAGSILHKNVEHGAKHLVPIPSPLNGFIVIGHATVVYFGSSSSSSSAAANIHAVAIDPAVITSVCRIDADGQRFLLGDLHGNLSVLHLHRSNNAVCGLSCERLGVTSIASSLAYLDNGVCFIGSSFGDSQLIRLKSEADEEGNYVQLLDTYTNIGPILDMVVVESEREGQSRLVTCSGAYKDGSIRVVRSGIGLQEQV